MPQAVNRGTIIIKSGVSEEEVPAGKMVKQYRVEYGPLLRLQNDAKGFVGTRELSDDDVVDAGTILEFIKKSGEKGTGEQGS